MKKTIRGRTVLSAVMGVLALAAGSFSSVHAGTESKSFKDKVIVETEDCRFRDMEFQVDAFYTGFFGSKGSSLSTGSGGGFGMNFFFARYFGNRLRSRLV